MNFLRYKYQNLLILKLQQAALDKHNLTLQRYTPNLINYMKKVELSISLTGYNTTMNIIKTGVNALVVPIGHYRQDKEQLIRTEKLENLGIVKVLEPEKLEPTYLAQKIIGCLHNKLEVKPNHNFDLEGSKNTAVFLKELLQNNIAIAA
ncbi:MAG: hypothetical protein F6K58_10865 [Symploca sp. SIO2E9]|nr:hypothetical protein [Symploca sp. SIO2E9]